MSNIIIIILAVLTISFAISYVFTIARLVHMDEAFKNIMKANDLLEEYIVTNGISPKDENIDRESFIKFLSDSRESAYDYIETVQLELNKFIKNAGPSIEYFNKYSSVMNTPLDENMKTISTAYLELKTLLPIDNSIKEK